MRFFRLALLALLAAGALAPAAHAQDAAPSYPAAEAAPAGGDAPAAAAQPAAASDAGFRAQPPRTLRAYWHVFAAFALAWVLLFGYVLMLGRRMARVERDVATLEREPDVRAPGDGAALTRA